MAENIKLPLGIKMREPFPSELEYFRNNLDVGGMATEDNKVILNPYTKLSPKEKQAVAMNESARIIMRQEQYAPNFELTEEQKKFLDSTTYKGASPQDRQATIAARIVSGDPSAGKPTKEQMQFVNRLRQTMSTGNGAKMLTRPINPATERLK